MLTENLQEPDVQKITMDVNLEEQQNSTANVLEGQSPPPPPPGEGEDTVVGSPSTVDNDEEVEDNGNSTHEYHYSRRIDPDLFEEDEDDIRGLQPPKPTGRNLRFTKSSRVLFGYGLASLMLAVGVVWCGIASFILVPQLKSRHSFQVEWKWTNLVLFFSGFSTILLVYQQTLTSVCSTLIFSLLGICMGFCTFVVHIVNVYFRRKDTLYYMQFRPEKAYQAKAVGNINLALLLIGFISGIVSGLLFRHTLHIVAKNFGYIIHIDKHRLRLSMLGLCQLINGLLITAWWIGIETIFQGENVSFHALPTSEVLAHGMVIAITGYIQMMATSKGCQPLLVCGAVLNAASFILATFFSARPLSIIYVIMEQASSFREHFFDVKFVMCGILCVFYVAQMLFSIYSLIKFVHLASGDRMSRIDNVLEKPRRLFLMTSVSQIVLGIIYTFLEIIAVNLLFLYKFDFSPLPLFIIASGILGYGAQRMGSPMLITVTSATVSLCAAFSFRDIYLFAFHTISHDSATADDLSSPRMRNPNLAVHFSIATTALLEVIVAFGMLILFLRTLACSVAGFHNRREFPRILKYLKFLCYGQTAVGSLILTFGIGIFLSKIQFLHLFGDYSMTTGLLLICASVLSSFIWRKPVFLLPSIATQIVAFTLIWQQSDEFAYLIHNYLDSPKYPNSENSANGMFVLSCINFSLFLLYFLLCGVTILLQGAILEGTTFTKISTTTRIEELVSMNIKSSSNAAAEFNNDFVEVGKNGNVF